MKPPLFTAACVVTLLLVHSASAEGIPEPPLVWYGAVQNNVGGQNIRLTSGNLSWVIRDAQGAPVMTNSVALTNINDQFSYVIEVPCESVLAGLSPSEHVLTVDPPATYSRIDVALDGQPLFLQGNSVETFSLSAESRGALERIDLAFVREDPDSDGDGLPDWWEQLFFPTTGTSPGNDGDGDGAPDGNEYVAGTDPTDDQSLFQIVIETDESGLPVVFWTSAPSKTYRILRANTLSSNPADFAEVQAGVGATPPWNQFVDLLAVDGGPYFYLLQVEE